MWIIWVLIFSVKYWVVQLLVMPFSFWVKFRILIILKVSDWYELKETLECKCF